MRKVIALVVVAFALVAAQAAGAHNGTTSIDCSAVTFSFTNFPAGPSTITYVIKLDGTQTASGMFDITGPSATKTIPNQVTGTHTVYAKASWTADGGDKTEATATVTCAPPATCPEKTDTVVSTNPLVCLRTVTVTTPAPPPTTVTVFGKPNCTTGVETGRGDGTVVCTVTNTVTKTVPGPVRVKVVKVKVKGNTVYVKVKWCPVPKPLQCKPGFHKVWDSKNKKYTCAVEGSG